jgi:hypothetical protein
VSCSAVEFPDGLGDGEACGRNAEEGGPTALPASSVTPHGSWCSWRSAKAAVWGIATAWGSRGCQAGISSLRRPPGKRWIKMESKFPDRSPSPVSMASVQPAPEVRRRVGRLSTPRRATWHSPGAARKSPPARRSMIRVVSPAFSRAAAVRRVLRTPSDPSGVRAPVPRRGQQRHAAATPQPRRRGRPADRPGGGVQRLVQGPEPDPAAAQPGHDGDQGPAGTGTAGPGRG